MGFDIARIFSPIAAGGRKRHKNYGYNDCCYNDYGDYRRRRRRSALERGPLLDTLEDRGGYRKRRKCKKKKRRRCKKPKKQSYEHKEYKKEEHHHHYHQYHNSYHSSYPTYNTYKTYGSSYGGG